MSNEISYPQQKTSVRYVMPEALGELRAAMHLYVTQGWPF